MSGEVDVSRLQSANSSIGSAPMEACCKDRLTKVGTPVSCVFSGTHNLR